MNVSRKMGKVTPSIETLRFLGGRLCLDFANTVEPRVGKKHDDFLASYADLVEWSGRAGLLTEDEMHHLSEAARLDPAVATAAWQRAIALREIIYRVFSSVAHKTSPQADDLEALKNAFAEAMTHAQMVVAPTGFTWDWVKHEGSYDQMLWPVIRSAVELLTSDEVKRVKLCPGLGDCGWLFLDTSKNGSRQWCSMEGCGSRAKMRHLYARKKHAGGEHRIE
jgi:predicted RNA-binding Zn ribbon-like protein